MPLHYLHNRIKAQTLLHLLILTLLMVLGQQTCRANISLPSGALTGHGTVQRHAMRVHPHSHTPVSRRPKRGAILAHHHHASHLALFIAHSFQRGKTPPHTIGQYSWLSSLSLYSPVFRSRQLACADYIAVRLERLLARQRGRSPPYFL